ncbi:MAG: HPr-rel-A system PqqD family peptide chaperone [Minicystis sp.]
MSNTKRLGDIALSDTGFAFDPYSGSTFTVNATGLCVLNALKEGLDGEAILARVRERFDARGADVARDVDDFVAALRQHGLIDGDSSPEHQEQMR